MCARRGCSKIHFSSRERWAIAVAAKPRKSPLLTFDACRPGGRIKDSRWMDVMSTLGLPTGPEFPVRTGDRNSTTFRQ
eukprot:3544504-Pleurochrysis_carterae.AAC.1